jgi:hypothetical protein
MIIRMMMMIMMIGTQKVKKGSKNLSFTHQGF